MKLVDELLADKTSGVRVDPDGRRYFRPRQVSFRTIHIDAAELHDAGWLGFTEALAPLDWENFPPSARIKTYAAESSLRFIEFWYRVFDVAVARALSGHRREIFRIPFFDNTEACRTLLDLGIPLEQTHSSAPPALHRRIIAEYRREWEAPPTPKTARIFYLSRYLVGLTDDVVLSLRSLHHLWDLKSKRRDLLLELDRIKTELDAPLYRTVSAEGSTKSALPDRIPARLIENRLLESLLQWLDLLVAQKKEREINNVHLRKLIFRRKNGESIVLKPHELKEIFQEGNGVHPPSLARALYNSLNVTREFHNAARSAAGLASSIYRLELRLCRLGYLHRRYGTEIDAGALKARQNDYLQLLSRRLNVLDIRNIPDQEQNFQSVFFAIEILRNELEQAEKTDNTDRILENWERLSGPDAGEFLNNSRKANPAPGARNNSRGEVLWNRAGTQSRRLNEFLNTILRLRKNDELIVDIYRRGSLANSAGDESANRADSSPEEIDEIRRGARIRYPGLETLVLPEEVSLDDPYQENTILRHARQLLLARLRPIRRTANRYSLIVSHRHGAMSLNPIMKLWKDKPFQEKTDDPPLTTGELNTPRRVACLLELAALADPALIRRKVERGRIARLKRGQEDLETMGIFLLPGSCYPIREVHRIDFPEYRNHVIGESRNPGELGVDRGEDGILTGGWYKKANHCLYYPVGGDNGQLLRLIWRSARSPGPPAFFFALGQFVHDCLPDHLIYFRTGEKTFRECVEEYYDLEDKVRKNRGEKFGRRKKDNSREAVRFMFAAGYARLMMEILTGSSQSHFRHKPTERWIYQNLEMPLLSLAERQTIKDIRARVRETIAGYEF